jgi:hypothetical protein
MGANTALDQAETELLVGQQCSPTNDDQEFEHKLKRHGGAPTTVSNHNYLTAEAHATVILG